MTHTVLLTGFGPFPGVAVNASALLVPKLARAARARFPGVAIRTAILPTQWQAGPARAKSAIARCQPDTVIHFGVSGRAAGFVIERRAVNACEAVPDGAGYLPAAPHLDPGGPKSRTSTFPAAAIIARLKALELPVIASTDAGQYLCNAVLFQSLGLPDTGGTANIGFVHIPASLTDGPLDEAQALAGGLAIIEVCLETAHGTAKPR
jgi:pyroglutamyl-peptidase